MKVIFSIYLLSLASLFQVSCTSVERKPTKDTTQEITHVFLLIGQSNMAGRAKLKAGDDKQLKNCVLWNGNNWEPAKAPFNRYSTHLKPSFTQGMNSGPEFVKAYQKANPGVKVGIINWARGGSSIEEWHPDHKLDLYHAAVKNTKAALSINGELKGILWHQGESNSKRSHLYPKQLKEHIQRLREVFNQPKLPVVYGQIGLWNKDYVSFNKMITQQPANIPYTRCIKTNDLTNFDPYHFDHPSQLIMGKRYAAEMLQLLKN